MSVNCDFLNPPMENRKGKKGKQTHKDIETLSQKILTNVRRVSFSLADARWLEVLDDCCCRRYEAMEIMEKVGVRLTT